MTTRTTIDVARHAPTCATCDALRDLLALAHRAIKRCTLPAGTDERNAVKAALRAIEDAL